MDLQNYCRLCLHQDHVMLNLFSDAMMDNEMLAKIEKYLYLDIKETDRVAKTICVNCVRKVDQTHSFCVEIHRNQEKIMEIQNNPNYQILFEKDLSVDDVTQEMIQVEPYHVSEELCYSPIINDLHFADGAIVESDDRSPEYQIMLVESPGTTTIDSPRPAMESSANELDCFDTYSIASSNEYDDRIENDFDSSDEWHKNIEGFPKVFIEDTKLVIRGRELFNLMSKFYRLQCEICQEKDSVFIKITTLLEHYEDMHSTSGYVKCCGVKLTKTRKMALHMARHVQPDAFKCPECGKMMTCPKILRYHIQNHLPEEKRPLACPKCPRRFSYSSALTAHTISHLPEDQRDTHICDVCGKLFLTASRLSSHISVTHSSDLTRYVCHECGRQFSCKGNLSYHLTTHEQIHQVQCAECKKWFKNKLCLRKHMAQHSKTRHQCPSCDYSSANLQCYRNHLRVQHSSEKPHECKECGRTFKLKNTLLNHIVQHTGERKYTCEFCTKRFASSGNYYSHRKRMHPNELAEHNQKRAQEKEKAREIALMQMRKDGT